MQARFSTMVFRKSLNCMQLGLYGYFYRLTGNRDTSNDLLSEVFVRLVEKIKSYDGGSFDLWLFKIASNIFYDHLRLQQRQKKFMESHKQELRESLERA